MTQWTSRQITRKGACSIRNVQFNSGFLQISGLNNPLFNTDTPPPLNSTQNHLGARTLQAFLEGEPGLSEKDWAIFF